MRFEPAQAVCIVTGASSGIGWHLCRELYRRGAWVVGTARRQQRLESLHQELQSLGSGRGCAAGGQFHFIAGDITSPELRADLLRLAEQVGGGRLGLLVNNAGVGAIGRFETAGEPRLRQIMEINFFAPAELTRAALPLLRRGRAPVICNIGSVLGHRAVPQKSEYCASKFALHGWSDALRAELVADNIQVTLVSPSTTHSEFFESLIDSSDDAASRSLGSWSPQRVARAALVAICRRRAEVILSLGGKALVYADRLAPPLMNRLLGLAERGGG